MDDRASPPNSQRNLDPLDRPPSQAASEDDISIPKKEPLPPITRTESPEQAPGTPSHAKPRILQYKRETEQGGYHSEKRSPGSPRVLQDKHRTLQSPTQQQEQVSVECQTEWSWLEDMKARSRAASKASSRSGVDSPEGETRKTPGTAVSRTMESELTFVGSEASIPYPPKEDEYGIPQLILSDSEYQRESERGGVVEVEEPSERALHAAEALSQEELEHLRRTYSTEDNKFDGPCEFCDKPVKPFPTLEAQKTRPPEELYCCAEYQDFVKYILTHPVAAEHQRDHKIDIKPHAPYGSGQARKAAKERAAQRMRERELAKQQAHIHQGRPEVSGAAGGPANFYQFARAMKTINYALSSQKCLDEGWTVRPPTPLTDADREPEVYEPEPILPPWADAEGKASRKRQLVKKYYEDGKIFVILFPDGTGTVYYPSGRPAVTITSQELGLYTYVVQDDHNDPVLPNVLAMFDSSGYAGSYFNQTNQIRLCMDQIGGLELDPRGARKRRWSWKDQVQHVHAPPIQPITFSLTSHLGVRIMSQDNITLTFSYGSRSVRFQTGARLKLVAPEYYPEPEIDEDELYRSEVQSRIESLFAKVANLLKFPNSPKLSRLPEPKHITSKVNKMEKIKEVQTSRREAKKNKGTGRPIVSVN